VGGFLFLLSFFIYFFLTFFIYLFLYFRIITFPVTVPSLGSPGGICPLVVSPLAMATSVSHFATVLTGEYLCNCRVLWSLHSVVITNTVQTVPLASVKLW
jgi:hypothetical protein